MAIDDTPDTRDCGLRATKRQATRSAIEEHATRLVAKHGFESVTVEDICQAAGISKRTFFNYVDNKETAVFGDPPRPPNHVQRKAFLATRHPSLIDATLRLSFELISTGHCVDRSRRGVVLRRRKEIRQHNPESLFQRSTSISNVYKEMSRLLEEYFCTYPDTQVLDVDAQSEADATVALVAAALQLGFVRWTSGKDSTIDALERECAVAISHLNLLCESR